ncbi:MAG TPA: S41 family peptidase [Flavobacterium sp.]|nr:S41 family peptidase [Flavobacterium sp.]
MKFFYTAFLLFFSLHQLNAQTASGNGTLSKIETDSLIANYCKVLNRTYFNKALSKEITATLQKKLKAGEFYNVSQTTDRLSLLLRKMTNDNHFYIGINKPADTTRTVQAAEPKAENKNGGLSEAKMINGNIGYIKWDEFIADEASFQKVIAALEFVKGCKYLIFDLSECPGGDGEMGGFVNSHLFEGNAYQDLLRKKCGGESEWHQSEVPYNYSNGPKFYGIPVFVIVSKHTASAAEYFALTIKEMKRGVILGGTTAGAGNPSTIVTFGNYFAQIPICEIVTKDGISIEGKGVTPNVTLRSDDWIKEVIEYIKDFR